MLCNITDCSLIENNLRCKLWHSVPLPFPFCILSSFVPVRLRMLNPSTCTSTTNNYPTPHIFSNIFGRLPSRIWMTSVAHPPPLNSPSTLFLKDKIECKRFQVSARLPCSAGCKKSGYSRQEPASSKVTYFILRAYTGTGVSQSHRTNRERFWKKMQVNGPEG